MATSTSETVYTFRAPYPQVLARGRAQTARMEVRRNGSLVVPSSGTYSLLDPNGGTLTTGSVTVTSSIATYAIPADALPSTLLLGPGYLEVWALTIDGIVYESTREAGVARFELRPAVSEADLLQEDPDLVDRLGSQTTVQPWLDAAWARIIRRIWGAAQFPDHILDRTALVDVHRELAQHLLYRWMSQTGAPDNAFVARASGHYTAYEAAFSSMTWRRDTDGDGVADSNARKGVGLFTVVPNGAPVAPVWGRARLPRGL
jgi:hypothetical protein